MNVLEHVCPSELTGLSFVDSFGRVCLGVDVKGGFLFCSFCGINLWN